MEHLTYLSKYADDAWRKYRELIDVQKFKAIKAERDSVKNKASNLRAKLDYATREKHASDKRIGELEKALAEETRRNEALEIQLSEHKKSNDGLEQQVRNLENGLDDCKRYLARLESEKIMFEGKEITRKQIDEIVVTSYNEEVERRSREKLDKLANELWPAWHEKHHGEQVRLEAEETVNELARKQLWDGMFITLNEASFSERLFQVTCDKCETTFSIVTLPADVEVLARTGEVEIECSNESCVDEQWIGPLKIRSQRHTFKIRLYEFLRSLASE
jgi:uncharacterized coiled-coil protein SlyX